MRRFGGHDLSSRAVTKIRLHILGNVVQQLAAVGITPDALVPGLVLDPPDEHGAMTIELGAVRALCEAAAQRIGDPYLGLHAARALAPGAYGIVEYVIRTAPTTGEALDRLVRLAPLLSNLITLTVQRRFGKAIVDAHIAGEPQCLGRQANEFLVGVFYKVGLEIAGTAWSPRRVWFPHAAPPDITPYAPYFGTERIEFGADTVGLEFDLELLDLPIPTADVALYTMLDHQARERILRLGRDELEPVREQIRRSLQTGGPDLKRVAALLGTSVRSLQRRLAEASTSFRQLVDEVRHELALLYLNDHARPMTEIAYLLGFSDMRAFARAHKRWAGVTPHVARMTG